MAKLQKILSSYWGYTEFRPLQREIIESVLEGRDTLALMPTGGGKSLTFQIPSLAMDGICLVITPLIALMKDQVDQLTSRGIKAASIHSGMTRNEISVTLDNCTFGDYKFLYVSPERIRTEVFQARISEMKVNLLAVDEAHCISEWGYDFRPSYLEIKSLRDILEGVPVLALTATATPKVCKDIQEKLAFGAENLFSKSFNRENLTYVVRRTEDKQRELVHIAGSLKGSGIVYSRNRKKCAELAVLLREKGITATYYHAGLKAGEREERQQDWIRDKYRVMVATNAFGMGIDKADVRFVIHVDLPDNPEAYFQEAGRAGRDEKKAWAILLYAPADKRLAAQRLEHSFPGIDTIRQVYMAICNYLQVPLGSGKGQQYDFELGEFLHRYKFNAQVVHAALAVLGRETYLTVTEAIHNPSRLMFLAGRDELYSFQVKNAELDGFIRLVLRSYSGLFSSYVRIEESYLARRSGLPVQKIKEYLKVLSARKIVNYIPRKHVPVITMLEERLDEQSLRISPEQYRFRKERYEKRLKEMLRYAESEHYCRNQFLLGYFGQISSPRCGRCDVCISHRGEAPSAAEIRAVRTELERLLGDGERELEAVIADSDAEASLVLSVMEFLLDEGWLYRDQHARVGISSKRKG